MQLPIECNAFVNIDPSGAPTSQETRRAVDGLIHTRRGRGGDEIDPNAPTGGPFDFLAGTENPWFLPVQSGEGPRSWSAIPW